MTFIRTVITVAMAMLFALSIAGWIWAGGQPPHVRSGARVVLLPCALMALGTTSIVWGAKGRVRVRNTAEDTAAGNMQKETAATSS